MLQVKLAFSTFSSKADKTEKEAKGAVVVAQLAERLLLIPENPGSNPVIGNFYPSQTK